MWTLSNLPRPREQCQRQRASGQRSECALLSPKHMDRIKCEGGEEISGCGGAAASRHLRSSRKTCAVIRQVCAMIGFKEARRGVLEARFTWYEKWNIASLNFLTKKRSHVCSKIVCLVPGCFSREKRVGRASSVSDSQHSPAVPELCHAFRQIPTHTTHTHSHASAHPRPYSLN